MFPTITIIPAKSNIFMDNLFLAKKKLRRRMKNVKGYFTTFIILIQNDKNSI